MSRIACFAALAAVLFVPAVASAQAPAPSGVRPPVRVTGAPPFHPIFTTEQRRTNTYQTYPRGSSGCIEDLGYGRVRIGCSE